MSVHYQTKNECHDSRKMVREILQVFSWKLPQTVSTLMYRAYFPCRQGNDKIHTNDSSFINEITVNDLANPLMSCSPITKLWNLVYQITDKVMI